MMDRIKRFIWSANLNKYQNITSFLQLLVTVLNLVAFVSMGNVVNLLAAWVCGAGFLLTRIDSMSQFDFNFPKGFAMAMLVPFTVIKRDRKIKDDKRIMTAMIKKVEIKNGFDSTAIDHSLWALGSQRDFYRTVVAITENRGIAVPTAIQLIQSKKPHLK